jgi:putative flippase GtrA
METIEPAEADTALFHRWIRFNGIGALGAGLQLAVLGVLIRTTPVHYLWATAIAVEAAVLHNFCWHERWTWSDRAVRSWPQLRSRLIRFHASNGAISFAGNVLLMRLLTGSFGVDPIGANIAAILVCSCVNFAAGEWLVFRRVAAIATIVLAAQPAAAAASEDGMAAVTLKASTIQAWKAYEQVVDARYKSATATASPFFALDAFGQAGWRAQARSGAIAMAQIRRPGPADQEPSVPDGKIHHWAGAIFVPGISVETLLARLRDLAGNEQQHYSDVVASRKLEGADHRYRIFMKVRRSKVITVTYNTEHDVQYSRFGGARAGARSVATRIAQLEEAGTPRERELTPGSDGGYLWRLNAYWRYEAVPGGVMVECESVSLSRDIPFVVRFFATGIAEGLARESLERTLVGLRTYLTAAPAAR